jgi:hypothetical protein
MMLELDKCQPSRLMPLAVAAVDAAMRWSNPSSEIVGSGIKMTSYVTQIKRPATSALVVPLSTTNQFPPQVGSFDLGH